MRVGLDTNVLAYVAGVERVAADHEKVEAARGLLPRLAQRATLITPVQALAELFVVLARNGWPREAAQDAVVRMRAGFDCAGSGAETLFSAMDAAVKHKMQLWDALILTAAAEAGCRLLLSEDMHPGLTWRGVAVVNPFVPTPDRRLSALLPN